MKKRSAEEVNSEDTRKGPWSVEEDTLLQNYVATHGDGRWNSVARCAGTYYTLSIRYQTKHTLNIVDSKIDEVIFLIV